MLITHHAPTSVVFAAEDCTAQFTARLRTVLVVAQCLATSHFTVDHSLLLAGLLLARLLHIHAVLTSHGHLLLHARLHLLLHAGLHLWLIILHARLTLHLLLHTGLHLWLIILHAWLTLHLLLHARLHLLLHARLHRLLRHLHLRRSRLHHHWLRQQVEIITLILHFIALRHRQLAIGRSVHHYWRTNRHFSFEILSVLFHLLINEW